MCLLFSSNLLHTPGSRFRGKTEFLEHSVTRNVTRSSNQIRGFGRELSNNFAPISAKKQLS